jgi:hypothetical protein
MDLRLLGNCLERVGLTVCIDPNASAPQQSEYCPGKLNCCNCREKVAPFLLNVLRWKESNTQYPPREYLKLFFPGQLFVQVKTELICGAKLSTFVGWVRQMDRQSDQRNSLSMTLSGMFAQDILVA